MVNTRRVKYISYIIVLKERIDINCNNESYNFSETHDS